MSGLFISFEGGEGCGKTAQSKLLARALDERASVEQPVLLTREPAATEAGRRIWDVLARGGLDATTELFLFLADRAQHVAEVIAPALAQGRIVVCDRFSDSTAAYQGYGRCLDRRLIERLNRAATGGLKPDLTFLLDVPVEVGLARQGKAGDAIGGEGREFHERVRQGYLALAARDPGRWRVLDAATPLDEVSRQVWETASAAVTQARRNR